MEFIPYLKQHCINYTQSLLILVLGYIFARIIKARLLKFLSKHSKDITSKSFLVNATYGIIIVAILISALGKLGFPTSSLITILAAGSLSIGLALKDSLGNVASGILLIILRPFKTGDLIEVFGITGEVDEINLFTTRIKTENNDCIFFPNAKIMSEKICNRSFEEIRRIELILPISYASKLSKTKEAINNIISKTPRILTSPPPEVTIKELGEKSVFFSAKIWVHKKNYSGVYSELIENLKESIERQELEHSSMISTSSTATTKS